jgi:hypothetical protein
VSEFLIANLNPNQPETRSAASAGRDILDRPAQDADLTKDQTDAVIAEFFAKIRTARASK